MPLTTDSPAQTGRILFLPHAGLSPTPDQSLQDIPKSQKQSPPKPLSYYEGKYSEKKRAMAEAYCNGGYTLQQVGAYFGVSYATVSRAVKALEGVVCCKVRPLAPYRLVSDTNGT